MHVTTVCHSYATRWQSCAASSGGFIIRQGLTGDFQSPFRPGTSAALMKTYVAYSLKNYVICVRVAACARPASF